MENIFSKWVRKVTKIWRQLLKIIWGNILGNIIRIIKVRVLTLGYLHSFILLYAGTCFFHISYSQREILDIFEFYVMPEWHLQLEPEVWSEKNNTQLNFFKTHREF